VSPRWPTPRAERPGSRAGLNGDTLAWMRSLLLAASIIGSLSIACTDDGDPSTTNASGPTEGSASSTSSGSTAHATASGDPTTTTGSASGSTSSATMATTAGSTTLGDDTSAGSSDTGTSGLVLCGLDEPPCAAGMFCQVSGCCFGVGVCVPEGTATCRDTGVDACADGLSCLQDACVSEQPGVCLPWELVDEVCIEQPIGCWTICPVP
jgi:hypothetical protein